jgi:hypothetical protein
MTRRRRIGAPPPYICPFAASRPKVRRRPADY